MEIQADNYNITLSHSELWDLSFNVRRSLYNTFKDHWVNHQDAWKKNEKQRMSVLKTMFYALGRPDLFEDIEIESEKIFLEFNKKRGSA